MEMDMQEPGEMRCRYREGHGLVSRRKRLQKIIGSQIPVNRIIISCLSIIHPY